MRKTIISLVVIVFLMAGLFTTAIADDFNSPKTTSSSKTSTLRVLNKALSVSYNMDEGLYKNETLKNIAVAFAQLKDYDQAVSIANMIKGETTQVGAFVWIARHYKSDGQVKSGVRVLSRAIHAAYTMDNSLFKAKIYETLANEFDSFGLHGQSAGLMKQAQIITKIVHGINPKTGN